MANAPYRTPDEIGRMRRRLEARRRRRRRIMRNRIIFAVLCLAFLALLILGITKAVGFASAPSQSVLSGASTSMVGSQTESSVSTSQSGSDDTAQSQPISQPQSAPPITPAGAYADPKQDPRMILVNNNVPIPDGYQVDTQEADPTTKQALQAEAAQAFIRMKDAAAAQQIELRLYSGYQSAEEQQQLFDQAKKEQQNKKRGQSEEQVLEKTKKQVQLPGCSEHGTGLALDLILPDQEKPDSSFAESTQYQWLEQHAAEHGFILRYPKDKQAITGVLFQPWHLRYVGPENAAAIRDSGLCLEEYLAGKI